MVKLHYTPPLQRCSCCGQLKPTTEYYPQPLTNAPSRQCKECILIKKRAKYQQAKTGKFVSKERIRSMDEVQYTNKDWEAALLHFRACCCYCGIHEGRARAEHFDREHLVPLSRGGAAVRSNIAPACRLCNRGRGNKPLFEWFRSREFWTKEREDKIVQWMGEEAARKEGY